MTKSRRKAGSATATASQVRIIGGQWRGRKLPVSTLPGLRPTPDRVRETLFNWLTGWVAGSHCLDCFSGSGALALEALSRGAEQALMVESNPQAADQLRDNLRVLNADHARLITADSLQLLTQAADQRFDLVFLDPPFHQQMIDRSAPLLEDNHWLADDAMIYIEAEPEWSPDVLPENWQLYRQKQAGKVTYRLFQRSTKQAP